MDIEQAHPPDWESQTLFCGQTGHDIYYVKLKSGAPSHKTLFILPGLGEFTEKYAETAQNFAAEGYNVLIIDWAYQGRSTRFKSNPHKRHSDGFKADIEDLHAIFTREAGAENQAFFLGHSMGGNLALRYCLAHPEDVTALSLSAPMVGISDLKYTGGLIRFLKPLFMLFQDSYVPGGKDWQENSRPSDGTGNFQGGMQEHLYLNNGQIHRLISKDEGSLHHDLSTSEAAWEERVDRLFLQVLSRRPDPEETERFVAHLSAEDDQQQRLHEAIWTLMTCSEFRFNH